ncbi:Delta(4)-3-oxosteroid 5beta-reductase [Trifolium repens]|nr:Delta(4)-3-oxosteroid 5beta-reductase [Trifolium repens]
MSWWWSGAIGAAKKKLEEDEAPRSFQNVASTNLQLEVERSKYKLSVEETFTILYDHLYPLHPISIMSWWWSGAIGAAKKKFDEDEAPRSFQSVGLLQFLIHCSYYGSVLKYS